jgi:competence protein ComEA
VSRSDRISLAAAGAAVVLAVAAAWMAFAPAGGDEVPDEAALLLATPSMAAEPPSSAGSATIVVDVQGAVVRPGVRALPAGSRIADAIAAAGGYGTDADLAAASTTVNLAQPLVDGQQVRVPRIGDTGAVAAASAAPGAGGGSDGGRVNLNTATPEELEALPGIGPVTVQKIVAARQERPFASLEDAVERGVLNRGQLEDIRDAATAG